jgi:hypothetical protein
MSTWGGRRQVPNHELQLGASAVQQLVEAIAHVADVEVHQARLGADDERARHRFVLRAALAVRVAAGSRHAAEPRHVRMRRAPDQQDHREQRGEQHALEDAEQQHADQRGHRHPEFEPAELPHAPQFGDVDEALDGDQHDRREHDVRQIGEQTGQQHQAQHDRQRGEDERQRCPCAAAVVDGRLRQTARDRIALRNARGEVGCAEREQLLARVDFMAVFLGERPRRGHALDVGQHETGERQREHAVDIARAQRGQVEVGQARRQRADRLEPEIRELREAQGYDRRDDDEQCDRARRCELLAGDQDRDRDQPEGEHRQVWWRRAG